MEKKITGLSYVYGLGLITLSEEQIINRNIVYGSYILCKCELNPNYWQDEEQKKWEADYIKKNGHCRSCENI